jgi:hypothetical protein
MPGFLLVPASTHDDRIGHQQVMRACPRLRLARITALRADVADDDFDRGYFNRYGFAGVDRRNDVVTDLGRRSAEG